MSSSSLRERRRYFRLRFPKKERPTFACGHGQFEVLEAAEKGVRVAATALAPVGQIISGRLTFSDGHSADVQMRVFRHESDVTVLNDVRGVTMSDMMREQRRLLKKYAATDFLMAPRS